MEQKPDLTFEDFERDMKREGKKRKRQIEKENQRLKQQHQLMHPQVGEAMDKTNLQQGQVHVTFDEVKQIMREHTGRMMEMQRNRELLAGHIPSYMLESEEEGRPQIDEKPDHISEKDREFEIVAAKRSIGEKKTNKRRKQKRTQTERKHERRRLQQIEV